MSPVAIVLDQDLPTTLQSQKQSVVGSQGPRLVIGSPSTAQDGTYPDLIKELEKDSANVDEVEKQMLDRILDGGKSFTFSPRRGQILTRVPHSYLSHKGQVFFRPHDPLDIRLRDAWIQAELPRFSNSRWSAASWEVSSPQRTPRINASG